MNCLNDNQLNELLHASSPDLELLEHVTQCEACAARLAELTLALPVLEPPAGMQEEILQKATEKPALKLVAKPTTVKTAQKPESLGAYALRVFAAMAAVLVLLFSGAFEKLAALPQELPKLKDQIVTIFIKEDIPDESQAQ